MVRKIARQPALEFLGQFRVSGFITRIHLLPFFFDLRPFSAMIPCSINILRNLKRTVSPAESGLRRGDLFVTERFAMHLGRALTVGRTLADCRAADDKRRFLCGFLRLSDRLINGVDVVSVDRTNHIPAIGLESAAGVIAEPAAYITVNRNTIVIVKRDELIELPDARQ